MPSKGISAFIALVGLVLMSVCAGYLSKEKDKTTSKYKGLVVGVVFGVVILCVGIYLFFSGSASVAPNNGNNNNGSNSPSEKIGSETVIETKDPLNIIEKTTHKTALAAAMNAENAKGRINAAEEAFKTVKKLGGLIGGLGH